VTTTATTTTGLRRRTVTTAGRRRTVTTAATTTGRRRRTVTSNDGARAHAEGEDTDTGRIAHRAEEAGQDRTGQAEAGRRASHAVVRSSSVVRVEESACLNQVGARKKGTDGDYDVW
jgi:hypothetical protein